MKPFFALITVFVIAIIVTRLTYGHPQWETAGRVALSVMLIFTAIGHFAFKKGMEMMIPPAIPFKSALVFVTGIFEVLAAITVHIPSLQVSIGWFLIIFFITLLPANIYAATKRVDYQKATYDGPGLSYLWFRVPFQLFLIAWTYLSAIR
jgi:uncharacterized membrane protein